MSLNTEVGTAPIQGRIISSFPYLQIHTNLPEKAILGAGGGGGHLSFIMVINSSKLSGLFLITALPKGSAPVDFKPQKRPGGLIWEKTLDILNVDRSTVQSSKGHLPFRMELLGVQRNSLA